MARKDLILDRYEPLGTAGAGGFGTVRIAWDPRIQRKVAIKTIGLSEADAQRAGLPGADAVAHAPSLSGSTADRWHGVQPWDEFLEEGWEDGAGPEVLPIEAGPDDEPAASVEPVTSLAHIPGLDEARTAAKLQDTRIVGVFDFEVRGQIAYLIMEYVEGITLTELLADYEDFLTLDVVAAVFDAVAGALAVAHKAGVLHLDIKPDNILINADGQAKVTDFGLATLADAAGTGTAGGGTIGYMPLEQMRREPLDARTDEWSLASVVYEMLTGDNPFRADDLDGAETAIENAEIVVPSLCWDDADEGIDDVVFRALDPDRERRFPSVAGFAKELDKCLGDAAAGKEQLAVVVQDALGVLEGDEEDDADAEVADKRRGPGPMRRLAGRFGGWAGERFAGRWPWLVERVGVAGLVAYLGFFALSHLYGMAPLFGQDAGAIVAVTGAVALAVVAAFWPPVGILAASVFVGLVFSIANCALIGIALAVGALLWWYAFWQLDGQGRTHPVLLRVVALLLVALLVALLVFVPLRVDFMPAAVVVIVAIALSGALL